MGLASGLSRSLLPGGATGSRRGLEDPVDRTGIAILLPSPACPSCAGRLRTARTCGERQPAACHPIDRVPSPRTAKALTSSRPGLVLRRGLPAHGRPARVASASRPSFRRSQRYRFRRTAVEADRRPQPPSVPSPRREAAEAGRRGIVATLFFPEATSSRNSCSISTSAPAGPLAHGPSTPIPLHPVLAVDLAVPIRPVPLAVAAGSSASS